MTSNLLYKLFSRDVFPSLIELQRVFMDKSIAPGTKKTCFEVIQKLNDFWKNSLEKIFEKTKRENTVTQIACWKSFFGDVKEALIELKSVFLDSSVSCTEKTHVCVEIIIQMDFFLNNALEETFPKNGNATFCDENSPRFAVPQNHGILFHSWGTTNPLSCTRLPDWGCYPSDGFQKIPSMAELDSILTQAPLDFTAIPELLFDENFVGRILSAGFCR